jgi:hypothetical protein
MTAIPLSATNRCSNRGRFVAIVDREDADLMAISWHAKVSRDGPNMLVYAIGEIAGKKVRMHRLIWERANGPLPAGMEVDHIEHGQFGGLDNRRANLRAATHAKNIANGRLRSSNTSGVKGVHYVKRIGRWQALIRRDGKRKHLGYFDSPLEAGRAYDAAAVDSFGQFARLNAGAA